MILPVVVDEVIIRVFILITRIINFVVFDSIWNPKINSFGIFAISNSTSRQDYT